MTNIPTETSLSRMKKREARMFELMDASTRRFFHAYNAFDLIFKIAAFLFFCGLVLTCLSLIWSSVSIFAPAWSLYAGLACVVFIGSKSHDLYYQRLRERFLGDASKRGAALPEAEQLWYEIMEE